MRASVVMTTYNGASHVRQQIESILMQLRQGDELIISDDASTDGTLSILAEYQNYARIIQGPRQGVIGNVQHALNHANGDVIFFADQDDVWMPSKRDVVCECFEQYHPAIVITNVQWMNQALTRENNFRRWHFRRGYWRNLLKNTYLGCAMAISADLKKYILPFPTDIPMHDVWIGLVTEKLQREVIYIDQKLMQYRRHDKTLTGRERMSLMQRLLWRLTLLWRTRGLTPDSTSGPEPVEAQ